MEFSKKFVLVPEERVQVMEHLSELDQRIENILHNKDLTEEEKTILYLQVLQKYTHFSNENRKESESVPNETSLSENQETESLKENLKESVVKTEKEVFEDEIFRIVPASGLSSSYPRNGGNSQIGETSIFSTADCVKSTDYSSKDNPRILLADFGGENKNCFICGDSSHCARDCEKRFKPKESNSHIHNKINVNTLKVESEKQNSVESANLQYASIFVENQPVTALIDSGCQIPVLNSSLIRVQTPSEEIITLSPCFGEQRMVEVKLINISLDQHSPSLSVRTAISPTLTEEFIIHPSVYSEIKN
ncbi:hypothetical protein TNCV_4475981 [Trichonephila clavipes]|nr:hypothetical protein TNCV_4475981 [Trichonephila clavipes]